MILILEIPDNQEATLKAKALSHGMSAKQFVQQMVDFELAKQEGPASGIVSRRISQRIAKIVADVPAEEFAKVPKDGARQVDHYIYGLPKRD